MRLTIIAATAAILAAPAGAQQADATSTSQSQSGVHSEGDNIRNGSVVAPGTNSTAPCVVGHSFGVAAGGAGIGYGGGKMNAKCVTRMEAKILTEIATMPRIQQRAAVVHFCRNDKEMRQTMIDLGWCRTR